MSHNMYLENEVMNANPGKLILMLYDGAINFLRRLDKVDYAKECETKTYNINKAFAIISELQMTLKMEYKEIADPLYALYSFMQKLLLEANLNNKPENVAEVIKLLQGLREGWGEIVSKEAVTTMQNKANIDTTEHIEAEDREAFSIAC